jgi:BNR repeat-containing family member
MRLAACGGIHARGLKATPRRSHPAIRLLAAALAALALAAAVPTAASAVVLGAGGWSYFGDPRAVHAEGKTFIGYTGTDGYIRLAEVERGRVIRQRRLGPPSRGDEHTNPSIYLQPSGRLTIFYNEHQGPKMYIRTTRYRYSFRSISAARSLPTNTSGSHGYSYPNPLRADRRLWLFWRGGNFQPNYSFQVRGRWTSARTLAVGPSGYRYQGTVTRHRPYAKYDTDGQDIHATMTEGHEASYRNSIYYAKIGPTGLYTATGRRIARLGGAPSVTRLDKVRGAASKQWVLDIAKDGARPVIVYRRGTRPREYWSARHDGARWRNHKITNFTTRTRGQVGSITLDHETPNTVYLSRMGSRGKLEVDVWVTPDYGVTWTHRSITRDSREDNLRPVTPRRLTAWQEAVWVAGTRTYFRDFDTEVIYKLLEAAKRLAKRAADKAESGGGGS